MKATGKAAKSGKGAREGFTGDAAELVRHYADAFVGAAIKENQAEAAIEDLEAIDREILAVHPEFRQILASSQVATGEKDRILVSLLSDRVSSVVLRFLRVLNRRDRLALISPLAREARQVWDRRHHRIPVSVRTAVPLDSSQEAALLEQIRRMISGTPILQITTDPSLIGGLVVQVGDQVCDVSVRNRLEQLRQRLIEGKTHEIQSRRDQFSHPA
jgi:F-type H+-transporting ATPase subunit delta